MEETLNTKPYDPLGLLKTDAVSEPVTSVTPTIKPYDPLGLLPSDEAEVEAVAPSSLPASTVESYDPLGILAKEPKVVEPTHVSMPAAKIPMTADRQRTKDLVRGIIQEQKEQNALTEFNRLGPSTKLTPDIDVTGTVSKFAKDYVKAAGRVGGATLGTMALYPGAGIAGIIELVNSGLNDYAETGKVNLNFQKANAVVEEILSAPQKLIKTPEEKRAMELISYVFKPIEMSGEGWRLIGQEIERLTGIKIPYLEPILGTMGEAAAMFTLPEFIRKTKAAPAKAVKGITAKPLEKLGEAQTAKHPEFGPKVELTKYGLEEKPIPLTGTELARKQIERDIGKEITPRETMSFEEYANKRGMYDKFSEEQVKAEYKDYAETGKLPEDFVAEPYDPLGILKKEEVAVKETVPVEEFTSKKGNVYTKREGIWYDSEGKEVTNSFKIAAAERGKTFVEVPERSKIDQKAGKEVAPIKTKIITFPKNPSKLAEVLTEIADGEIPSIDLTPNMAYDIIHKYIPYMDELITKAKVEGDLTKYKNLQIKKDAALGITNMSEAEILDLSRQYKGPAEVIGKIEKGKVVLPSKFKPTDTLFNKPELHNNKTYAWRSMGEKEYTKLLAGEKEYFGDKQATKSHFLAGIPESAAQFGGKGKYLVEFGNIKIAGAEGLARGSKAGLKNVSKVWKYNDKGKVWEEVKDWRVELEPKKAAEQVTKAKKKVEEGKAINKKVLSEDISTGKVTSNNIVRGTDLNYIKAIIKNKDQLVTGKDFEGNNVISASKILSNETPPMYGGKDHVVMIGKKGMIEAEGHGVNEVWIDPKTNPRDFTYIYKGKKYTYDELKAEIVPKPKKGTEAFAEAMKKDLAAEVEGTAKVTESKKKEIWEGAKTKSAVSKTETPRLHPAIKIDGEVHVAKLPDGTTHGMMWDTLEGKFKGAKDVTSGWANPDGSGFVKTPPKKKGGTILTSGVDLTRIPETARGLKHSAQDLWDTVTEKSSTMRGIKETSRITKKELKELTYHPEGIVRKDPSAKETFKSLINAEENKNAFLFKNLRLYAKEVSDIKPGSESSINIGKVLDGKQKLSTLTKKERKAHDFLKENFDFLIHEYARRAAGSEAAYKKILREVGAEHPKRTKIADLDPARAKEYAELKSEAAKIRDKRKKSELTAEERVAYDGIQQEMRDVLNRDYVNSLSAGEREAHLILSRRIDQYLPHLFDPKELLGVFKANLEITQGKLAKATKKGNITKYKKKINSLTAAITKLEGGEFVSFRQLPKEIFFAFFSPRKGKVGYSFDAMKAYETYLHGIARKMFDEPALKQIATELFPKVDPSLKPYVQQLVNHYMGYDRHPMNKFASAITTFQWIRTLGFNPRSAIVNLSQRINTVAYAGEKWAAKAEAMMLKDMINKRKDRLTGKERTYESEVLFDATGIAREVPSVLTEGPPSVGMKAVNDVARYMFNQMELGNRKHSYLAGHLKAIESGKKKGLSGEALADFAKKEGIKTVHETQFRYGKLGMPKMYWNPYARVALQFTSYPIKQARFLYRLFKKDKVAFMKYAIYAEGVNYTLRELLDMDMSNALGFGISWGEALSTVLSLGQGDERGALRHAKQTVNLGGGLLPSGFGPTVASGLKIADKIGEGKGTEQLGKELTPIMATRLIQAYKAVRDSSGGEYPIYSGKYPKYRLSGKSVLQRTIGPRTATELKESRDYEARKNLAQEKTGVIKDMVDAYLTDDITTLAKLYKEYGFLPTSKQIDNEKAKRALTEKERRQPGTAELFQLSREGKIY